MNEGCDVAIIGDFFDVCCENTRDGMIVGVDDAKIAIFERPELAGGIIFDKNAIEGEVKDITEVSAVFVMLEIDEVPANFTIANPFHNKTGVVVVPGSDRKGACERVITSSAKCFVEVDLGSFVIVLNVGDSDFVAIFFDSN